MKSKKIIRPKILGDLKIVKAIAGNVLVDNGIKSPPNKIRVPCESREEAVELIERLKNAKVGDVIYS